MELSTTAKRRASLVGVLLLVVALVVFASRAQGNVVPEPDLHDGGIWVTNEARGLVGRTNAQIATVDAKLSAGARDFDVLQSGNVVVVHGQDPPALSGIDPAQAALIPGPELSAGAQVGLGAETAALFDPDSGGLFIVPATSSAAVLALDPASDAAEAVHTVAGQASLAVGVDGLVHLYDGDTGEITTWDVEGKRVASSTVEPNLRDVVLTAVGERPVLFDGDRLLIPGQDPVTVDVGDSAVVQEPGPAADTVLVAGADAPGGGRLRRRRAGGVRWRDRRARPPGAGRGLRLRRMGRRPDLRPGLRRRRADRRRIPEMEPRSRCGSGPTTGGSPSTASPTATSCSSATATRSSSTTGGPRR